MVAQVLVEIKIKKIDKTFTYQIPKQLEPTLKVGMRVLVPFGKQSLEGFVLEITDYTTNEYQLKEIISQIDEQPVLNKELLLLGEYIQKKTMSTKIHAYQTMLPVALKAKNGKIVKPKMKTYLTINPIYQNIEGTTEKQKSILSMIKKSSKILKEEANKISAYTTKKLIQKQILIEEEHEIYRIQNHIEKKTIKHILNPEQEKVVNTINANLNNFKPFLLHGVTGSGKTEVYMHIIEEVLKQKKEAIVLVPEISLTPQLTEQFKNRFGSNIAILHSRLSDGEKYDEWRKIERNEVSIVIGARSAIFAPLTNIGIIIIDEEHSQTYKQENTPRYHAIDIALKRGKTYQCPVILGSATPSIESYTRAKIGIYQLLEMKNRVNKQLPSVECVDMKEEIKKGNHIFSNILKQKIEQTLNNHQQVILLLNRRGYSTILTCKECGNTIKCPNCDIPLTHHKTSNTMRCHYCGYNKTKVQSCPQCHSKNINEFGIGTEKLEQLVKEQFKEAKCIRMDVDTTNKKGAHEKIIEQFTNQKYNILIGTQMIAKGLDFPNVSLVGVIGADNSLNIPDFRSAERTYQLLSQVAGRAGRSTIKGQVIFQGFNMDHYSILCASIHDYESFYEKEMQIRKILKYPPFYNLCLIKLQSKNQEEANCMANKIVEFLKQKNISDILGPTPTSIPKINNIYYMQILIKYKQLEKIYKILQEIQKITNVNTKVGVEIDINPIRI